METRICVVCGNPVSRMKFLKPTDRTVCSMVCSGKLAQRDRPRKYATEAECFWAKVNKTDTCWLWTAATNHGHGLFKYDNRTVQAHRYSWELHNGPIPDDKQVNHIRECPNSECIRPDHLYLGTQAENMADMVALGRHGKVRATRLSATEVIEIGEAYAAGGDVKEIADAHGVQQFAVWAIVAGRTWKHITAGRSYRREVAA